MVMDNSLLQNVMDKVDDIYYHSPECDKTCSARNIISKLCWMLAVHDNPQPTPGYSTILMF